MLKKILMVSLALVMLLQCGCGAVSEPEVDPPIIEAENKLSEEENVTIKNLNAVTAEAGPKVYPDGLDVRLDGVLDASKQDRYVKAEADAYVVNGESSSNDAVGKNYGKSEKLEMKSSKGGMQHRITYLRFDISNITDPDVVSAFVQLNCVSAEISSGTEVFAYACTDSWNENTITHKNRPSRGKLVGSNKSVKVGLFTIDLTSYVKEAIAAGKDKISIALEGTDSGSPRKLTFDSKESKKGMAPVLCVQYEGAGFTTDLNFVPTIINPWSYAMECVSTFLDRWTSEIESMGNHGTVKQIPENPKEYRTTVGAARAHDTNGDATKYTSYKTRVLDTLVNYTYNKNEQSQYDVYGGYMGGERYEATGFFHTKRIDGRWWVIDPLGYPYFRAAVNAISNGGNKGAIAKQFGSNEKLAIAQTRYLMDDLGFNSCGGWSDTEELSQVEVSMSQTMILNLMIDYTKKLGLNVSESGNTDLEGGIMPVFDPGFAEFCRTTAKSKVAPYVNNPNVYGWMLDNELPGAENMLDSCLTLDHTVSKNFYSYATAWTFMYIMTGKNPNVSLNDVTDELREQFRAMVWDRYYEVTTTAVREVDPNHMILGSRLFNGTWTVESILKAGAYWCDVITANVYGQWTPSSEWIANVERWTDKPFIITEWYAKGMDVVDTATGLDNKEGAGFTVKTQADRGLFYQNFALKLLEAKNCVGFDWFKYWDDSPGSSSTSNKGIYSHMLEEYTILTESMKEVNLNKYSLIEFFDGRS